MAVGERGVAVGSVLVELSVGVEEATAVVATISSSIDLSPNQRATFRLPKHKTSSKKGAIT